MEFEGGDRLDMTEAGTEHRASLRVVRDPGQEAADLGGLEPLSPEFTRERFARALRRENRQTKNALRSRDVVAGIGNAYSDEILHAARVSPLKTTERLTDEEIERLRHAVTSVLSEWIERVRAACPPGALPEKQPMWRKGFAVHGKAGRPCPECGTPIERISYRDSETNYCPACQSEGRVLADRRLSKLGIRRPIRPARDP
jgi:formamidopyrimidine-DNA glycosylase